MTAMHMLAVVDNRRDLDLLERNLILQHVHYVISYEAWTDEFADGWHWVLSAECTNTPEGPRAA